ncbi:hypothetical protein [Pseudomonas sp. NY15354]|uniref:hypothetical protein n=1 Tax=Pseudomonas sp. NY15354 TaxID=3400351 RepID=UPI003A8B942B
MVSEEKAYIIFSSLVMTVASKKFKADTSHEEAEEFVRALFKDYMAQGLEVPEVDWVVSAPKKVVAWITKSLANSFKCYGAMPIWIDEPGWRYIEGRPMDFVHQFQVDNGEDDSYSGVVTYVFFGRKQSDGGQWELVVKLIQQDKGEAGTIYLD